MSAFSLLETYVPPSSGQSRASERTFALRAVRFTRGALLEGYYDCSPPSILAMLYGQVQGDHLEIKTLHAKPVRHTGHARTLQSVGYLLASTEYDSPSQ